jgi:hypothetical protein
VTFPADEADEATVARFASLAMTAAAEISRRIGGA